VVTGIENLRSSRWGKSKWSQRETPGAVSKGGDGHCPVGAFVGAEDDCGPAVPGALVNLFEGHAVLPADGAEPGAERDGVLVRHSFSVSLFGGVVDDHSVRSVTVECPDSALLGGFVPRSGREPTVPGDKSDH